MSSIKCVTLAHAAKTLNVRDSPLGMQGLDTAVPQKGPSGDSQGTGLPLQPLLYKKRPSWPIHPHRRQAEHPAEKSNCSISQDLGLLTSLK